MIVEVEAAGEGDLRPGRQHHLGLGAALGGEEVAAVDHRRGQRAVVDKSIPMRGRQAEPVWTLEVLGGLVAEELEALRRSMSVRPSAVRRSSSTERTSEPSCSRWLLRCACSLSSSCALDPVAGAVEEVDGRPEQILEIGFEPGVAERGDQRVEDVGDRAGDRRCLRAAVSDRARRGMGGSHRAGVR